MMAKFAQLHLYFHLARAAFFEGKPLIQQVKTFSVRTACASGRTHASGGSLSVWLRCVPGIAWREAAQGWLDERTLIVSLENLNTVGFEVNIYGFIPEGKRLGGA
jgi:hypothetical protein